VVWVDVDNNGVLDGKDVRIKLTGIPTLTGADVLEGSKVGSIVLNSGESFYGTIANDSVTIADQAFNVTVDGGAGNDTIMIGDDVGSVTVLGGADDDTIISGDDSADASTDSVPGTVFTAGTTIDGGAGNDTLYLDHGDNISAATVTGIETVVLMHSTVTMTVAQHNSFTNIKDGDIGTADTINLVGGGSLIGSPDVETYVLGSADTQIIFNDSNAHTVTGGGANDSITGGSGNDNLFGGSGNDTIIGGLGDDSINGNAGNDNFIGADNSDSIDGEADTDTLQLAANYAPVADANLTNVEIVDGSGVVAGININLGNQTEGFTSIIGGTGNDTLTGGSGADTITGDSGADVITGGLGDDNLSGGAGNDTFVGADNGDTIDGGADTDTLQPSANYTPAADANLEGVENVTVTGNLAPVDINLSNQLGEPFTVVLSGMGDTITTSDGNDTIIGGNGNDSITAGDGNNTVFGGGGYDTITGGILADVLNGEDGIDWIYGGDDNDTINGGAAADRLFGQNGDDTFIYEAAGDFTPTIVGEYVDGGANTAVGDTLLISAGANIFGLTNGQLTNVENVTLLGSVSVVLVNQTEAFTVNGSGFNDTITTGSGNDTIYGNAGNDSITAGDGNNEITGGIGNDTIISGLGNDTIFGADNNDSIDGGGGTNDLQLSADYAPAADGNLNNVQNVDASGASAGVQIYLWDQTESFTVTGSNFNDHIWASKGGDIISGGTGDDTIQGNVGNDSISGGAGDDRITDFVGTDTIDGGTGANTLRLYNGGPSALSLSAALDTDLVNIQTVDASGSLTSGLTLNLSAQTESLNIIGTSGVDTITAATGGGSITGGLGADIITLGAAVDTLAYTAIDESRGVNVDQVTGFTSLTDMININDITGGSGVFLGNAVDNVSAQMALTGTSGDAVYSIAAATLYVDVNGDAVLNNADLAIHLIGVAALNSADITF
jgi:Ca2+-binding RTX toxin-like protein